MLAGIGGHDLGLASDSEEQKHQQGEDGDEPEPINIVKVSPKEAKDLIFDVDSPLKEARAIASLTLAMNKLGLI